MAWLGVQRVIWENDLAVLLGRLSGRPLAESGTRDIVARWQRAGWVSARKVWTARPRVVMATALGAGLGGVSSPGRPPAEGLLQHAAMTSRVRLFLEGLPESPWRPVSWVGEWEWRREKKTRIAGHAPDGIAVYDVEPFQAAIECELTPKSQTGLEDAVEAVCLGWPSVLYFCPPGRVGRCVQAQYDELVGAGRVPPGRLQVLPLPGALTT